MAARAREDGGREMKLHGAEIVDTFAEAFPMWGARVVITAATPEWALLAGRSMTGFATSVIGCKCEASIERVLEDTPDGRPGVSVLLFAMDKEGVGKRLVERVGQCVLTSPTAACFNGLDAEDTVDVGGQLRYFGDGYQASKVLDGERYWRVPVMEGEFLVQERFGVVEGVAGGNIIMLGRDLESALRAAEAAASAMRSVEGVIMPFPGGIARSGSKVGSRYSALPASTNHVLCPTLRGQVDDTDVPARRRGGVRDRHRRAGARAGPRGDARRPSRGRRVGRQPRDRRQLRWQPRPAPHPPSRADAVTLTLTLREQPDVPLEAEVLTPERLAGDIAALPLWHGKERTQVGEFFEVSGSGDDIRLEGDLSRVRYVGAGMTAGRLTVAGDVGAHAGAGMRGGELHVEGDAGDHAGAGMHGGTLVVRGSAGSKLGSERMRGGEIVVHGDVGAQAGAGLRRGLIAVADARARPPACACWRGPSSRSAGSGRGREPACGAARSSRPRRSRFRPSRSPAPTARRTCASTCAACGRSACPFRDEQVDGRYARWCGDGLELNRGEILILEDA